MKKNCLTWRLFITVCAYTLLGRSVALGQADTGAGVGSPAGELTQPRTVVTAVPSKDYPVGVITVLYDGKPIRDRVPFNAPDDWVKHLTVVIRNESSKTLIWGSVQVAFPRLSGSPMVVDYAAAGALPEFRLYRENGEKAPRPSGEIPVAVGSHERLEIPLARVYEKLKSRIEERAPLSSVSLAVIDYGTYYFEGDLRWSVGSGVSFMRADPTKPGRYIPDKPDGLVAPTASTGR